MEGVGLEVAAMGLEGGSGPETKQEMASNGKG